jgi:hypothetical protein
MNEMKEGTSYGYDHGGRPTKYRDEYADVVRRLVRDGGRCTDRALATHFELAKSTINRWKLEQPSFLQAIKEARELCSVRKPRFLFPETGVQPNARPSLTLAETKENARPSLTLAETKDSTPSPTVAETKDSTRYREAYADQVRKLGLLSSPLTEECLAEFLGVPRSTIALWKQAEPSFSDVLRHAKLKADASVTAKLWQRATGYEVQEEKEFELKDTHGNF